MINTMSFNVKVFFSLKIHLIAIKFVCLVQVVDFAFHNKIIEMFSIGKEDQKNSSITKSKLHK